VAQLVRGLSWPGKASLKRRVLHLPLYSATSLFLKPLLVFLILLLVAWQPVFSQSATDAPKWAAWGHAGVGTGVVYEGEDEFGLLRTAHFGGNLAYKSGLLSYTYTRLGDLRGLQHKDQNAIDSQQEQAFLIGIGKQTEKTKYFFSSGYSWGKGTYYQGKLSPENPEIRVEKFTYNGIPFRVTFLRTLTPWLGFGMETTANTNKDYPYLTLMATLVLGKL
jgi:hypothetical protein